MTVLVFAAHPDDGILGCGGTIAKYSREGRKVIIIIFSHGEGSDILKDVKIIAERRKKEAIRAAKIVGCKNVIFLKIADLNFKKEIKSKAIIRKVKGILSVHKPTTIFTHATDDPHPAHRIVSKLIKEFSDDMRKKPEIYTFSTSIPFRILQRELPQLYIDISNTYKSKDKALRAFKSQKLWFTYFKTLALIKNWLSGFKVGYQYAEVFYKW